MKKRLLLLSVLSLFLATTSWAYDFEVDNIQYNVISLDDMTAEVSGLTDKSVTEVVIPENVEYKGRSLSVISIGESAFSGNKTLQSVSVSGSVLTIGSKAFYNCTSLCQIDLSEGIQTIGDSAFYGSSLVTIELPTSITSIPNECFYNCKSLTEISLPSTLNRIGSRTFYNCSSLRELNIPDCVTSLGTDALTGCSGLDFLYVGAGLEDLYNYILHTGNSFYYYSQLYDDCPSKMESVVIKDGTSNFKIRGTRGNPLFSWIDVGYYYVGRPLSDIKSWSYYSWGFSISKSQPCGTIQTLEIGGYCNDVPYFYQSIEYLILGKNVATYTTDNIYQDNLKGIICRSAIPPTLDGTFNDGTYVATVLYVPKGSKNAYMTEEGWKTFWDIQELEDMPPGYSAVENIATNKESDVIGYYTTDGKKIPQPMRGINIIRYSDGTTKKVLVK